jgi:hypothetical protein
VVLAIAPVNVATPREASDAKSAAEPQCADRAGFEEALLGASRGAEQNVSGATLVPVVRTQLSAGQAQEALRAAWQRVTGEAPSDKTLALITAQWAHETGSGASMYNYNFAGIKGAGPEGLSVAQHTREGYGASERRIIDNFRAYRSAEEGAADYVQLLSRRFPEAVQGARQGDPGAFVRGLKARGYFTGNESQYLNRVSSIASKLLGQPLEPGSAPPLLDYASRGPAGASFGFQGLDGQLAQVGAQPASPDSFVDALSLTDQVNRAALRAYTGSKEDT